MSNEQDIAERLRLLTEDDIKRLKLMTEDEIKSLLSSEIRTVMHAMNEQVNVIKAATDLITLRMDRFETSLTEHMKTSAEMSRLMVKIEGGMELATYIKNIAYGTILLIGTVASVWRAFH